MHKIINKIHKMIFCLAVVISGICVNTTCSWKLYQEEIPMELHKLKKMCVMWQTNNTENEVKEGEEEEY